MWWWYIRACLWRATLVPLMVILLNDNFKRQFHYKTFSYLLSHIITFLLSHVKIEYFCSLESHQHKIQFNLGHITLNKRLILFKSSLHIRVILWISWHNQYTTFFYVFNLWRFKFYVTKLMEVKMISWKNLYGDDILFLYHTSRNKW
jgi:hypothetical protein